MTATRLANWRVVTEHANALRRLAARLGIRLTIEMSIPAGRGGR